MQKIKLQIRKKIHLILERNTKILNFKPKTITKLCAFVATVVLYFLFFRFFPSFTPQFKFQFRLFKVFFNVGRGVEPFDWQGKSSLLLSRNLWNFSFFDPASTSYLQPEGEGGDSVQFSYAGEDFDIVGFPLLLLLLPGDELSQVCFRNKSNEKLQYFLKNNFGCAGLLLIYLNM